MKLVKNVCVAVSHSHQDEHERERTREQYKYPETLFNKFIVVKTESVLFF